MLKHITDEGFNDKTVADLFPPFLFLLPVGRQNLLCHLSSQASQVVPAEGERVKHIMRMRR